MREQKISYDVESHTAKLVRIAQEHSIPKHTAHTALTQLTDSIQNVIDITANSPQATRIFLKSCVDPLISPEDFNNDTIKPLMKQSKEPGNGNLSVLCTELLTIRRFFVQDGKFLHSTYKREIDMIEGQNLEAKQKKFTTVLSAITKQHIKEISAELKGKSISR